MKSPDTETKFRVLGIRTVSIDALQRSFFYAMWALLGVEPADDNIAWLDEDVLAIGIGILHTSIDIKVAAASGHIDLWVDDLAAVRASLAQQNIPMRDGLPSAGLQCDGFNITVPGHAVDVRLSQVPPDLLDAQTR